MIGDDDARIRKIDIVDLALHKHGESKRALLVSDDGNPSRAKWIPKSQVEDYGDGTFALPEWLAKEKGFI